MNDDKNSEKYKYFGWNIFVSAFITFLISFIYIFTVYFVKKIFPVFTPIINQENLIFLIFLMIFSFVQYLDVAGNTISLLLKEVQPEESLNESKLRIQIKFIISIIFLLSSLVLPFFISFLYLKNIYPTFEQFFITGKPNWIVYLIFSLINYIILFIGGLILKIEDTKKKILVGIFGFPTFCLISIFIWIPFFVLYFISKAVPFLNPLFINCSNGAINWFSIIGIFLFCLILLICLSLLSPWINRNLNLLLYFINIFNYCLGGKKTS